MVNHTPRNAPWTAIASTPYALQEGKNRQRGPKRGLMKAR
jgi:hypothetical protein